MWGRGFLVCCFFQHCLAQVSLDQWRRHNCSRRLTRSAAGLQSCKCLNLVNDGYVTEANGKITFQKQGGATVQVPSTFGISCNKWDLPANNGGVDLYNGECTKTTPDAFCNRAYCYVDPCTCDVGDIRQTTLFASTFSTAIRLGWSYATCAQCPLQTSQATCETAEACTWYDTLELGSKCQIGADQFTGTVCSSKSQANCGTANDLNCKKDGNGACVVKTGDELTQAWQCGVSRNGAQRCQCIDPVQAGKIPVGGTNNQMIVKTDSNNVKTYFVKEYGSYCSRWDLPENNGGSDTYGTGRCTTSTSIASHADCMDAWCYVDPCSCDLPSQQTQFFASHATARKLAYSYASCAQCSARLTRSRSGSTECAMHSACRSVTASGATSCTFQNYQSATASMTAFCQTVTDQSKCGDATTLSCKVSAGACTAKTDAEMTAAWQCPTPGGAAGAASIIPLPPMVIRVGLAAAGAASWLH